MKRFRRRFRGQPLTTRRKVQLSLIAAVPVLAIFTFGNRGILKRIELEMERDRLHHQLYEDRAAADSLRTEIHRLNTDTAAIERLARERFGMVRPGETIYRAAE